MISVMLCYARSGGTLLNRCLGSMSNVLMLSEVNPICDVTVPVPRTVYTQAKKWWGIELKHRDFIGGVKELETKTKHLIIRDWSIVNFYPYFFNGKRPDYRFLTLDVLPMDKKVFGFVRDAIDVYISRHFDKRFAVSYRRYVEELLKLGCPIYKYEDLCSNPELTLRRICSYLEIEYIDVTESYKDYNNVTGDTKESSRGNRQKKIAPLKREGLPKDLDLREVIKINKLLDYGEI